MNYWLYGTITAGKGGSVKEDWKESCYYTDIEATAFPDEGYRFVRWDGVHPQNRSLINPVLSYIE